MTDVTCRYPGDRDEAIVSYLYEDGDAALRAEFEAHLPTCARCRDEVASLDGVRTSLGRWVPPEPARPFSFETEAAPAPRSASRRVRSVFAEMPAWAQVAAALLVLGVSASIANLDIRYDTSGLRVRTGWSRPPSAAVVEPARSGDAPWQAELTALEQRLRADLRQPVSPVVAASSARPGDAGTTNQAGATTVAGAGNTTSPDVLRRVRAMVDDSERRQQRELALRLAEAMRELNTQRQADLVKIDRSIGAMQNNTGLEILRTRETINNINNYLVRTSSQQRPQ